MCLSFTHDLMSHQILRMSWGLSRKTMKNSLERRILIFSLLALTLTIAVNTGFNVESFRRTYRDGILQRAQTFSTALKSQLEAVVNLGLPLEEIDGITERCQDIVKMIRKSATA